MQDNTNVRQRRVPISAIQIDNLIAEFYSRVRVHPVLGPIFNKAVGTDNQSWDRHEKRIASFWRGVAGIDRSFEGTPLLKHASNSDIRVEHFSVWLDLFEATAFDILPEDASSAITFYARRIGESMSFAIANVRTKRGEMPNFPDSPSV